MSFGDPAIVAHIRRPAVTRNLWLSEDAFQQGLALCQAVPGAKAMQCGLVLSFVGLLVSVAAHFATVTPWNLPVAVIAVLGLTALVPGVDVLWIVFAGAVASALLMA